MLLRVHSYVIDTFIFLHCCSENDVIKMAEVIICDEEANLSNRRQKLSANLLKTDLVKQAMSADDEIALLVDSDDEAFEESFNRWAATQRGISLQNGFSFSLNGSRRGVGGGGGGGGGVGGVGGSGSGSGSGSRRSSSRIDSDSDLKTPKKLHIEKKGAVVAEGFRTGSGTSPDATGVRTTDFASGATETSGANSENKLYAEKLSSANQAIPEMSSPESTEKSVDGDDGMDGDDDDDDDDDDSAFAGVWKWIEDGEAGGSRESTDRVRASARAQWWDSRAQNLLQQYGSMRRFNQDCL